MVIRVRKIYVKLSCGFLLLLIMWCQCGYDFALYWEAFERHLTGSRAGDAFELGSGDTHISRQLILNTSTCQIRDFDPFSDDVMERFRTERIGSCGHHDRLVYSVQNFDLDLVKLHVNQTNNWFINLKCSYRKIFHDWKESDAPFETSYESPVYFSESVVVPNDVEFALVICRKGFSIVFRDVFAFVRTEKVRHQRTLNQIHKQAQESRPLNILILGIDSLSRLNMIRSMPKTYKYLKDHNWYHLLGYNKVEENTLGNLMAVLAGLESEELNKIYYSHFPSAFDDTSLIWKTFKRNGYITAYAEDCAQIGTFHNGKVGFTQQPTDFYLRPFTIAAEKNLYYGLDPVEKTCLGRRLYAEYLLDYAKDLTAALKEDPYFALFWFNSFSHETTSAPLLLDQQFVDILEHMNRNGVLNTTLVIFLSDHGRRFGYTRFSKSGFLEDRMPAIFMSLPEWFKHDHPQFHQNLKINQDRLSSPYDLHLTLKEVLDMSKTKPDEEKSKTLKFCPTCQSLFQLITENRTCSDAGINSHWCSCPDPPYQELDIEANDAQQAIYALEQFIKSTTDLHCLCSSLSTHKIHSVLKSGANYLVTLETRPGTGIFEATIRPNPKNRSLLQIDSFNRLSKYQIESWCVVSTKNWNIIKVCYCGYLVPTFLNLVILLLMAIGVIFIVSKICWSKVLSGKKSLQRSHKS